MTLTLTRLPLYTNLTHFPVDIQDMRKWTSYVKASKVNALQTYVHTYVIRHWNYIPRRFAGGQKMFPHCSLFVLKMPLRCDDIFPPHSCDFAPSPADRRCLWLCASRGLCNLQSISARWPSVPAIGIYQRWRRHGCIVASPRRHLRTCLRHRDRAAERITTDASQCTARPPWNDNGNCNDNVCIGRQQCVPTSNFKQAICSICSWRCNQGKHLLQVDRVNSRDSILTSSVCVGYVYTGRAVSQFG